MKKEQEKSFMNIQLFAEPDPNAGTDPADIGNPAGAKAGKNTNKNGAEKMISVKEAEKLADQRASKAQETREEKLRAEFKNEQDVLKAELKKLQDAGKSENELQKTLIADTLKAAEDSKSKYESLLLKAELETKYATQGLTSEEYSPIVKAQLDGDSKGVTDYVLKAMQSFSERKAKENFNASAAGIPKPGATKTEIMTKEKFNKLSYSEMNTALIKNPEYRKLLKK